MKYKIGDIVQCAIPVGKIKPEIRHLAGKCLTVSDMIGQTYRIKEDGGRYIWYERHFEDAYLQDDKNGTAACDLNVEYLME